MSAPIHLAGHALKRCLFNAAARYFQIRQRETPFHFCSVSSLSALTPLRRCREKQVVRWY